MQKLQLADKQTVTPNPGGQKGFATDWEHFIIALEGGWFAGKTFIGSRKLISLHLYNAFDEWGYPTYASSLVVAPTYTNAVDFCIPALREAATEAGLEFEFHGGGYVGGGEYATPLIVLPDLGTERNPSVILIRSADIPKRITGFTVGAAWGDEPARWKTNPLEPTNDPYIQMLGRVRDKKASFLQICFTYTNEGDVTRIFQEMRKGGSDKRLYTTSTQDNPVADDFYEQQKRLLPEGLAKQYLEGGVMTLQGGRVYPGFNYTQNVDFDATLNRNLPIQLSLDFNRRPGMHGEIGQYWPNVDMITTIFEIHQPMLSVIGLATKFVKLMEYLGALITDVGGDRHWKWPGGEVQVFGDPAGRAEWSGTGDSCYTLVERVLRSNQIPYRMRVRPSAPLVEDRVNAVNCAFIEIDGTYHYKIHPRCERLIADYQEMQRDKNGEVDKSDRKLSHASDADGYRIHIERPIRLFTNEERDGQIRINV